MADPQIITTLRRKIAETENTIIAYEEAIKKARQDLAAFGLTMKAFEQDDGSGTSFSPTMSVSKLFRRGEVFATIKAALQASTEGLDTRELALVCLRSKGYDEGNAVLRKAMAMNIVNVMDKRRLARHVERADRRKGVIVWRLA